MGFITTDRNQMNLLGFSLDDLVPKDAKCRFVVDIVSQLDLEELYNRYSNQGNDAFEPSVMLSTWFYAYSETVTATRKLEEKCQRDLHYMYVSGNLRPDHTSLSRFRKNHLDLLADYFMQIIKIAIDGSIENHDLPLQRHRYELRLLQDLGKPLTPFQLGLCRFVQFSGAELRESSQLTVLGQLQA